MGNSEEMEMEDSNRKGYDSMYSSNKNSTSVPFLGLRLSKRAMRLGLVKLLSNQGTQRAATTPSSTPGHHIFVHATNPNPPQKTPAFESLPTLGHSSCSGDYHNGITAITTISPRLPSKTSPKEMHTTVPLPTRPKQSPTAPILACAPLPN